jgi:hypothetical protein
MQREWRLSACSQTGLSWVIYVGTYVKSETKRDRMSEGVIYRRECECVHEESECVCERVSERESERERVSVC